MPQEFKPHEQRYEDAVQDLLAAKEIAKEHCVITPWGQSEYVNQPQIKRNKPVYGWDREVIDYTNYKWRGKYADEPTAKEEVKDKREEELEQ